MADSKYYAKELNLYSGDSLRKLKTYDQGGKFTLEHTELLSDIVQPVLVKNLWVESDNYGVMSQPLTDALHIIRQSVSDETTARETDSNELWTELEANYASLNAKVSNEAKARAAADTAIVNGVVFTNNRDTNLRIDAEIKRASDEETTIKGLLSTEQSARASADQSLQWAVDGLSGSLSAEAVNREAADNSLYSAIQDEQKARVDADASIHAELLNLSVGAGSASAEYKQLIADEAKARASADADEKKRAEDAELALGVRIDNEATARWQSDTNTQNQLSLFKVETEEWEAKTTARIDFIMSNTNQSALDSLSEIVQHFTNSGQSFTDRLIYLEGVVAALTDKKKP
jgi:hypothetical protein